MRNNPHLLQVCVLSLVLSSGVWPVAAAGIARSAHRGDGSKPASAVNELDRLQHAAFIDLWEQRDHRSGLVYNTTEANAPASPAACGVVLSAIPLGIERGWIHRAEGYERAKQLLRSLEHAEQVHGFFYHFIDPRHGTRTWQSEVSCIDSSILFAGAMVVAEYFRGTEIERLANQLIDRAEWPWFLDGEETLKWSWKPETGFEGGSMEFSEAILAYLLALGSPTHPIPSASWQAMRRPITRVLDDSTSMVYTHDGSLFAYLLPLVWFDLRDQHDAFLDYWTNARTAILSNEAFSFEHRAQFATYREGLWGVSAALGPDGYQAYGAAPAVQAVHDGTVAPYVVMTALPWFPDVVLDTLRRMERINPKIWTRYGFGDALNLDRRFASAHTIALDQGMALLMIENLRTSLIWQLMMHHPVAQRALEAAGFVPGALREPNVPTVIPGNPGASMAIPMIDHAVTIDGDLSEWIRHEAMELSPTNRRNVESGVFKSAQDASALLYFGWTPAMFYVAGIVTDDE